MTRPQLKISSTRRTPPNRVASNPTSQVSQTATTLSVSRLLPMAAIGLMAIHPTETPIRIPPQTRVAAEVAATAWTLQTRLGWPQASSSVYCSSPRSHGSFGDGHFRKTMPLGRPGDNLNGTSNNNGTKRGSSEGTSEALLAFSSFLSSISHSK